MKDRPILFSGPMVRAILEGRKTQTRRIVKPQPVETAGMNCRRLTLKTRGGKDSLNESIDPIVEPALFRAFCPYGEPGDRLWVREAWKTAQVNDHLSPKQMVEACRDAGWKSGKAWAPIEYLADGHRENWDTFPKETGRYRHSRFMPRDYSRITLEIADVRVQRLQEITEEDCRAEGFAGLNEFACYWTELNGLAAGKPCGWNANPWLWAISFRRLP